MDFLLVTYGAYVAITLALTFWVGRTLFTNGEVFLLRIFDNNVLVTDSINRLLLMGFYLINFGYALQNLIVRDHIANMTESIEMLSIKIGFIVMVLGGMHFFNLFLLFFMSNKSKVKKAPNVEMA